MLLREVYAALAMRALGDGSQAVSIYEPISYCRNTDLNL